MHKLLVICGPTATGKTSIGIRLAKKFNGEIVSADSRQVYKGMDIGTGKDLSVNSKFKMQKSKLGGYYEIDGVKLWGYDLVEANEEFNISEYLDFAKKIIRDIQKREKLPILVGGTGFYIKGVIDGIPTVNIPANKELRKNLENIATSDLFEKLAELDAEKAGSMNSSDKKNPRRLMRAIEVAQFMLDHESLKHENLKSSHPLHNSVLVVGLTAPIDVISKNIDKRVDQRTRQGMTAEIVKLLKQGVDWSSQSMYSLGYRQWRDFFEGEVERDVVIEDWKREEKKYAKRQLTWWKRDSRVKWFDISDKNTSKEVEKMVKLWHN